MIKMFSDTLALSDQWQVWMFSDGESVCDQILDLGAPLVILDGVSLYKILCGHCNIPVIVGTGKSWLEIVAYRFASRISLVETI
ncbi:MAG: hypothetical protein PVS3B3_21210 [Ktedonobacteraceae bacterium]